MFEWHSLTSALLADKRVWDRTGQFQSYVTTSACDGATLEKVYTIYSLRASHVQKNEIATSQVKALICLDTETRIDAFPTDHLVGFIYRLWLYSS